MKKPLALILLGCSIALCFSLMGCGGDSQEVMKPFIGDWTIHSVESESEENSIGNDDVTMMQAMDLNVTLTLKDDKTATLDLFGEKTEGTWKAKKANSGTATMNGERVDLFIDDQGFLIFAQGNEKLVFSKGSSTSGDN